MMREGYNMNTMLRVKNVTKYDIGVITVNNLAINIEAGKEKMLEIRDILMNESSSNNAFFSTGKLVIIDENGRNVKLSEIGGYDDMSSAEKHITDKEIEEHLNATVKKIELWLGEIKDDGNREAIYLKAKEMDLSSSKMALLEKMMPEKLWHFTEGV